VIAITVPFGHFAIVLGAAPPCSLSDAYTLYANASKKTGAWALQLSSLSYSLFRDVQENERAR